jgi:hypothetical protein
LWILKEHATKFKKRLREKSWLGMDTKVTIPIELIADTEEQLEGGDNDWNYDSSDEEYSYNEVLMDTL